MEVGENAKGSKRHLQKKNATRKTTIATAPLTKGISATKATFAVQGNAWSHLVAKMKHHVEKSAPFCRVIHNIAVPVITRVHRANFVLRENASHHVRVRHRLFVGVAASTCRPTAITVESATTSAILAMFVSVESASFLVRYLPRNAASEMLRRAVSSVVATTNVSTRTPTHFTVEDVARSVPRGVFVTREVVVSNVHLLPRNVAQVDKSCVVTKRVVLMAASMS
jgi:hypothetical protein